MPSVISFSTVLIHWELIPRGEFNSSKQKKACQSAAGFGTSACTRGPFESRHIVSDVEEDWVRIVREVGSCYHMEACNVIDYYGDELKYVDGDELFVFAVRFEEKCPTLDLLGEVDEPPEA